MRSLKFVAYAIAGLIALVIVALLLIVTLVNPNNYKDRITRQVKTATGRDLVLAGDIKLSVFPWVALKLGAARLGNPAGFPDNDFVAFQEANLRVKVFPLLHGELEVGKIVLDGLDLNLEKNASGKGNWEDFGQPAAQTPQPPPEQGGSSTSLRSLAGVELTGRIRYGAASLEKLKVSIGAASGSATVPVSFAFELHRDPKSPPITVDATMQAVIDVADKRYGLHDLAMSGELGKSGRQAATAWKFAAPSLDVDLGAQTLAAPAFSAALANAQLSGSLQGVHLTAAPEFSGAVKLDSMAPRTFMTQFGMAPPTLRDPHVLNALAFSSHYRYGGNAVHLEQLQARLDDSTLQGSLAVTNLDTHALSFDLALDRIDLDRYRSPVVATPAPASPVAPAAPAAPADLPTAPVRALEVQGNVAIGSAKVAGMTLTHASTTIAAHAGVLQLAPIRAQLYGGTYDGAITYDVHGQVPAVSMKHQLAAVDIGALLKDAAGSQRVSGHGNANATLTGQGRNSDALLRGLGGQLGFSLDKGAVEGVDLWYAIGAAQSLLQQHALPATANTQHTQFDVMKMSATVAGGVATTHDLTLSSPYLRLTGQGTANLASKALDMRLVTTVLKTPPASQGADLSKLTLADIPVQIGGTLSSPSVRPDVQGLLKSAVKQKAQDLIKGKLNDQLHGLFGK